MQNFYRFICSFVLIFLIAIIPVKKNYATIYTFDDGVTGNEEVPPNPSTGVGNISGSYNSDGNILNFDLVFNGLVAPTTAAHFYGPAPVGATSQIQISFAGFPVGVTSAGYSNTYILTDPQEQDFISGLWYVNVHTNSFPDGEIRGQLDKVSTPALILTAFIQGFYNSVSHSMVQDTITVFLRDVSAPYIIIDSAKGRLNNSGVKTFNFPNAVNGISYYLMVKHRNSIETWSKTGQTFINSLLTYNFTNSKIKAFGDNLIQVDLNRFAIYNGDVNQDGSVDLSDLTLISNNAFNYVTGYVASDVNGDNVVDLSDISLADNNEYNFVSVIRP